MYTHDEYKELACITAYIVSYDLLGLGSFFNTFDAAFTCAESFLKLYPEGTQWGCEEYPQKEWDVTLEQFCEEYKTN